MQNPSTSKRYMVETSLYKAYLHVPFAGPNGGMPNQKRRTLNPEL